MIGGAPRAATGWRARAYRWVGLTGEFSPYIRPNSSLIKLLFLLNASHLFRSGLFLVHAPPLPLSYATGEGPGPTAHGSGEDESA